MTPPAQMKTSQFARRAGTLEFPAIFDLRIDADLGSDPRMMPGTRRHRFDDTASRCGVSCRWARDASDEGQGCPVAETK